MEEEKEEWDGPWKEALDCLALVFDLFWPNVCEEVALEKGWIPLEQELQKLTPDSNSGLLRVDKLFEMVAKDSGDPRIAHFEVQMAKDLELPCACSGTVGVRANTSTNPLAGLPSWATMTRSGCQPITERAFWVARTFSPSASSS